MSTLIFIDTNVFLDFYRVHGRQGDLSILGHIDDHRDQIITSSQVEMEFKKNRPIVLLESYERLKKPNWSALGLPAYLARSKQSTGLETGRKSIETQLDTLRKRLEKGFRDPTRNDPVYKVAQRLFRHRGPHNLTRENDQRRTIKRRAWRRFILGYPPRKARDTSIGDAINWEWLVRCAEDSRSDVVIVSRDSDFGVTFGKRVFLNDWLRQEFQSVEAGVLPWAGKGQHSPRPLAFRRGDGPVGQRDPSSASRVSFEAVLARHHGRGMRLPPSPRAAA